MINIDLEQFGLSEKEAAVYLALLEIGSSSVSEIASKAGINRTTGYDILESLIRHGLVSFVGEENKKHYTAESPEKLRYFIENKRNEFEMKAREMESALPTLLGMYNDNPKKPRVRYYEGEEGIKTIYEESLKTKNKEILAWLDIEEIEKHASSYYSKEYPKLRAELGIKARAITDDSESARYHFENDDQELREMRVVPSGQMDVVPESYIYDNKVAFMSHGEKFGVVIESADIANAHRKLFELAWKGAKQGWCPQE